MTSTLSSMDLCE
jgi:hypothetical protein